MKSLCMEEWQELPKNTKKKQKIKLNGIRIIEDPKVCKTLYQRYEYH